ncbi:hypothetical protein SAMN06264364_101104 [Quadrisphaera granulorum]|uniref:Uncharacterized protein n=1 Tax=Quadrisphaera granulorum TaxID=317664 RepID=A0A316AFJ9_9ACTN|nr:hypothetical protein [Quadrisphaera granulorum]PWJ56129.1 hypothetical protein BXY45_101104 [Quadrisphaera granulorum]SZE94763.1 hypothetical protein SAMN06264364_101104 [Quadrisphaera granulorum]
MTSLTTFILPERNITCSMVPVEGAGPYVRCDLASTQWRDEPPLDAGCPSTVGSGQDGRGSVGLGDGPAQRLCLISGGPLDGAGAEVLQYGQSITFAPITCTSSQTLGVTCTNAATQHGFTARRADLKTS